MKLKQDNMESYYRTNFKMQQLKNIEESIQNNKLRILSMFQNSSSEITNNLRKFYGSQKDRKLLMRTLEKNGLKSQKLKDVLKMIRDYDQAELDKLKKLQEEKEKKKWEQNEF